MSDERTVFPPPWWPDRADEAPAKATASARHATELLRASLRSTALRKCLPPTGEAGSAPALSAVPEVTILVDPAMWPWRDRRWAHLVSDESYDELHAFAEQLGIPRRAFQGDHYDVPADYRDRAIELGATPVSSRELVRRLIDSGLRLRKVR